MRPEDGSILPTFAWPRAPMKAIKWAGWLNYSTANAPNGLAGLSFAAFDRNEARRRFYIADIRLAQSAYEGNQMGRLVELLDGQRPERTGGIEFRGFRSE